MGIMDLNVETRPIVIIANYRTSSSALSVYLANHYGLARFSEPMNWQQRYLEFTGFMDGSSKNFVLKIIADQLDDCRYYREILARDCYKIRLMKRNTPEQIASHYIAIKTHKWSQLINEERTPRRIKTVRSHLVKSMNTILNNNALLEESTIQFDETIYTEDLPYLEDSKYKPSTKPKNYDYIYEAARELYETRDTYKLRLVLD
jgi:hypothetical protein